MPTLTMYSKTDCPYCDTARAFLAANAIPVVEIKHDDPTDRAAMYDRLGLAEKARTVPQIVLTANGEDFRIGSAQELLMSGLPSLFGRVAVSLHPAVSIAVADDTVGVVAVEGCACCE